MFFVNGVSKLGVSTVWTCGTQRPQTPHYVSVFNNLHLAVHRGAVLFGCYACVLFLFIYQEGGKTFFAFSFQETHTFAYQVF